MIQELLELKESFRFLEVVDFGENTDLHGAEALDFLEKIALSYSFNCMDKVFNVTAKLKDGTILHGYTFWNRGDGYDEYTAFSYDVISMDDLIDRYTYKKESLNKWYLEEFNRYQGILDTFKDC